MVGFTSDAAWSKRAVQLSTTFTVEVFVHTLFTRFANGGFTLAEVSPTVP
jgi:hypothetical protein